MNEILRTFNFKDFLIKEYNNWYLILRSEQVTIGSLVLIEKNFHKKLSDISNESFSEFGEIIREVEAGLEKAFHYDKINYLMLMMKDSEVHYHIIPRYSEKKIYELIEFIDQGWPGMPDLGNHHGLNKDIKLKIKDHIKKSIN